MTDARGPDDRIATLEAELGAVRADNARLRRLLTEAGMPDGLRHAFRDTVAMLHTLMRRTADNAADVEDYNAHLTGRLNAITRTRFLTDAFGEAELQRLIADALNVYLVRVGEQAILDGPDVRLRPKAAEMLALALHELATNAVEHGLLGGARGSVAVSWRVEGGAMLALEWRENGATEPPVSDRQGFGTTVLQEMLPYQLGAKVTSSRGPDGLHCTIHFPLTSQFGRVSVDENFSSRDDELR